MNRAALYTVWWQHHVYGAECCACHVWMYPVSILCQFGGFYGAMKANGKPFNYRFCSETCIEDFKIKRLEERWDSDQRRREGRAA